MTTDLALIIVFAVIIIALIISSLIGLWKGCWKTGFKMIFRIILFIVLIFTAQPITNFFSTINFQTTFGADFQIEGIQFTSLNDFLINILMEKGNISPVTGQSLYATCEALAHSILSFAFFFILAILAWLFGSLLGALFYHVLFKHLIPSNVRKEKKVRWLGMIFGLVDGLVCLVMIISPLSSLGTVVINNRDTFSTMEKNGVISEESYTYIDGTLTSYENSILGKTFSAIYPFTDSIMNGVVTVNVHGANLNFYREIDSLLTLITPFFDNVENLDNQQYKLASLISKENVKNMLYLISDNQLVITLIPALILMGDEMANNPTFSSIISKMNLNEIDWKDNIVAIGDFYGRVYDTGILDSTPEIGTIQDIVFELDYNKIDDYASSINTVTEIPIINDNLALIMSISGKMINQQLGISVLPENVEDYEDINWGNELLTLTSSAVKLIKSLGLDTLDLGSVNYQDKINSALNDPEKLAVIKEAICGDEEKNVKGLLNLQIIDKVNLTNLFYTTITSIDQLKGYIDLNDIKALMVDLKLENEIGALLDIAGCALDLPKNDEGVISFDFSSKEQCDILSNLVDKAEKSTIISSIFPRIVRGIFESNKNINLYGFNYENFNFEFSTTKELTVELKKIINVLPDVSSLANAAGDNLNLAELDTAVLKNVLNVVYNSKILNPDHRLDGTGGANDVVANYNFQQLVQTLFEMDDIKNMGFVVPDNLGSIMWNDELDASGNIVEKGEISKLIDIIDYLKGDGSFLLNDDFSIDQISGKDVEKIVDLISSSELFSPSLKGILENKISPMFNDLGLEISFANVDNYQDEASHLGKILDLLKIIAKNDEGVIDFENVDWLNVDRDYLNGILTEMESSKLFGIVVDQNGQYVDIFGKNLFTLLSKADLSTLLPNLEESSFQSINSKDGSKKWEWSETIKKLNKDEYLFNITTEGEIYNIIQVLTAVDSSLIDDINNGRYDTIKLYNVIEKVLDTNTIASFVPSLIKKVVEDIEPIVIDSDNSIDLKEINLDVFEKMDKEEKKSEIKKLLDIYDKKDELTNAVSNLFSMSDDDILNLKDTLDDFASLKIFNTPKDGNYYSLFDESYASLFNSLGVDKLVTNVDDKAKSKKAMLIVIADIDNWTGENGENQKIIDLFTLINHLNIDESSLNNPSSLEPSSIKEILYSFNNSALLHRGVSKLIQQVFKGVGIENLIAVEGKIYYPIKYFVHLKTSDEDLSYWKNEIDYLFNLVEILYDDINKTYLDTSTLDFSSNNISDIIVNLDHIDLLKDNKEYIIYNFLKSFPGVLDYIRDVQVSYGNSKAARIKKLFFPLDHSDEDLILQTSLLSSFIGDLSDNLNKSFDDKSNLVSDELAYSFIRKTMKANTKNSSGILEVSSIDRSLFASELITNFLYKGLLEAVDNSSYSDKETMKENVKTLIYAYDELGNEYKNINVVEARGIQGLLKIAAIDFNDFAASSSALIEAFKYMGQIDDDINTLKGSTMSEDDAMLIYTHNKYYSSSFANRKNNSQIALLLVEIYLPDTAKTFINYLYDYDPKFTYEYKFGDEQFVFGEFAKALENYYSA